MKFALLTAGFVGAQNSNQMLNFPNWRVMIKEAKARINSAGHGTTVTSDGVDRYKQVMFKLYDGNIVK